LVLLPIFATPIAALAAPTTPAIAAITFAFAALAFGDTLATLAPAPALAIAIA
jgi:hypothetical protein